MSMHFPMPLTLALPLPPMNRRAIEDQIELLIALLDATDGDPDLEEDCEDRCSAGEDDAALFSQGWMGYDHFHFLPDENEEEDDAAGDDCYRLLPLYGVDQSRGPLNHIEAERAHLHQSSTTGQFCRK